MASAGACDRCYLIKARCIAGERDGDCYRCYRLHHPCTHTRRRGKPGRKPREFESVKLPPILLRFVCQISEKDISRLCEFFSVAPTLSRYLRPALHARMIEAPQLLLDPSLAVARVFLRTNINTRCDDNDVARCASALESLRNSSICQVEHVGSVLALGLTLQTFQRLTSGVSADVICRATLHHVQPWYEYIWNDPSASMELVCLVFIDTMQSLFRRRVPVLPYRVRDPFLVDRYAGICCPLLPLLYRVCVIAAEVRESDAWSTAHISTWEILKEEIHSWLPSIASKTFEGFSEAEKTLLMTQAQVYRHGALLILQRIRFPLANRDDDSKSLSRSIVNHIRYCFANTGHAPRNITLPFLVAAAEAENTKDRHEILSLVSILRGINIYPCFSTLKELVQNIWAAQDCGNHQSLFSVFDQHAEINILP